MNIYLKVLYSFLLVFFGIVILLPSLNEYTHIIKEVKGNENRTLASKPILDKKKLDRFVKEYDSYYTENFNLRDNLIQFHNKMEYSTFDVSPVPNDVVIGKEGWFYNKNNLPNYKGVNLFSKIELENIKKELALRTDWAAKKGIKYYLAIIPNKMSVYPEFLPSSIIKLSDSTRYEQIVSLDNHPTINVIDVKKRLMEHKYEGHYIYQHTDDHWNDLGAYYGYQAIMDRIALDYPDMEPEPINDFRISTETKAGNMAMMMSVEKENPEKYVVLTEKNKTYGYKGTKRGYPVPSSISDWDYEIVTVNDNGKKLRCLVIRDSFTLLLVRYLKEHFKECVFIHDEWKYRMREDLILKEKPDIVINIMVETGTDKLIQFPFHPDQK